MGQVLTDMMNPTCLYPNSVLKQLQEARVANTNVKLKQTCGSEYRVNNIFQQACIKNSAELQDRKEIIRKGMRGIMTKNQFFSIREPKTKMFVVKQTTTRVTC